MLGAREASIALLTALVGRDLQGLGFITPCVFDVGVAGQVSESEDDEEGPAPSPRTATPLSRLTPPARSQSSASSSAPPAAAESAGFGALCFSPPVFSRRARLLAWGNLAAAGVFRPRTREGCHWICPLNQS